MKIDNLFRKKICIIANNLFKSYNITRSESFKISWKNQKLKKKMYEGGVHFFYRKLNGEMRESFGTLRNIDFLLTGSNKFKNDILTFRYYNLINKRFESFKMYNLLEVDNNF